MVQERYDLFAQYGWKSLQKIVDRITRGKILDERMDWHARADKHRSTAKNIG